MKLRVLFIKKKHIFYSILVLLVLVSFIVFLSLKESKSSNTFKVSFDKQLCKTDFNGDGKDDNLYLTLSKDKYALQMISDKKTISLKPNKEINTLGTYQPHWSIRIKILDVNRDKIPEIFVQSSQKNKPIQHGFFYKNDNFETMFSNNNNILGFMDCSNNKTPKILTGTISKSGLDFSNYILVQDSIKKFPFSYSDAHIGGDTISKFIDLITTHTALSDDNRNILCDNINSSSLGTIKALTSANNKSYIFQDAEFIDIQSYNNGTPLKIQWTLNFREILTDQNNATNNYTLKVILKSCDKNSTSYKLESISKIPQKLVAHNSNR